MKKILITFSLFVMVIVMACNSAKNSVATTATPPPPPAAPDKPQKSEMNRATNQITPTATYEKKSLPKKGLLQPMQAVSSPDTVVPKH